jgi:hypothetical protein
VINVKSGLYIPVGKEKKDLILECTTAEVLEWLKFCSKEAYDMAVEYQRALDVLAFRLGYIPALAEQFKIITLFKNNQQYEAFMRNPAAWSKLS